MKFYLISDNHDTKTGLRLAGIEGCIVHTASEVERELKNAAANEEIAVVLITEKLVSLCPQLVYSIKLSKKRPLITEIPDRHSAGRSKDYITRYIKEAIGVKL
jgi:V/A-type H+-transporting ATPase subunit F